MAAGQVDTLLILGGNPVYDAPADLEFARARWRACRFSVHLGPLRDETAAPASWHVRARTSSRAGATLRAYDGTQLCSH